MSVRAVFLDRDGVLNVPRIVDRRPYAPTSLLELDIAPGTGLALTRLRAAGFRLVVVTNQPEVARGTLSRDTLDTLHRRLRERLPVDEIRVCPHDNADGCECRKPAPGMLLDAAREAGIDLQKSFLIGDRWRDVEAAQRAGCRSVLIDYDYDEPESRPDHRARTIEDAVEWILGTASADSAREALGRLRVKVFADGADLRGAVDLARNPLITGFTTNPTLMRKAGVTDYKAFAREMIAAIPDRPISLEVFSDDMDEMERQALTIASWGENVFVKVPVTDTSGVPTSPVVRRLTRAGVKVNVTAVLTIAQVRDVVLALSPDTPAYVSVFAGRIADTGRDPLPLMSAALALLKLAPAAELIWASPRELLNLFQADAIGCHIITATSDILKKLEIVGRDLSLYSLDTVRMFHKDAAIAGYDI